MTLTAAVELDTTSGDAAQTDESAQIASAMVDLIRVHASIRAQLADTLDAETSDLLVLVRLVSTGPLRLGELALRLSANGSTLSRQVGRLVSGGLVNRRPDPEDRRASILVPTAAGIARVDQHRQLRGRVTEPVVAAWSPADRATFLRLLTEFTAGLDAHRDSVIAALITGRTEGES